MRTVADLLQEGSSLSPRDVGQIMARAAGLLRYGHEQGAAHGDLTAAALLVEERADGWAVEMSQPRPGAGPAGGAADDVLALGKILQQLTRDIAPDRLPQLLPAALSSMMDPDPARRPSAAQVEQYFEQDFLDSLPHDPRSARTTAVPVVAPAATGADDEWQPRGTETTYLSQEMSEVPVPVSGEPRGRGAALVVSVLVLLLGLGAVGYVVWRTLAVQDETVAAIDDGRPTDQEPDEEEPLPDATDDESVAPTDDPTGDEDTTEPSTGDPLPAVPVPATPSGNAPPETQDPDPVSDHTLPDWEDNGWDVQALDDAYCRDGSRFIGLADTETYRGVICGHASGYSYRGLNKAANATLHSSAEATASGWEVSGEGGVSYVFDEDSFIIRDGDGDVVDEEQVDTWLTPQDTPFRPGDLDLDQPITYPACDGSAVVVLSSWRGSGEVAELVQSDLDENPGSYYIRTDLACDNFNRPGPDVSGMEYIYSVLLPVGYDQGVACAAIEEADTFGYWLEEDVPPGVHLDCD